jgi:hypothetical protein
MARSAAYRSDGEDDEDKPYANRMRAVSAPSNRQ